MEELPQRISSAIEVGSGGTTCYYVVTVEFLFVEMMKLALLNKAIR